MLTVEPVLKKKGFKFCLLGAEERKFGSFTPYTVAYYGKDFGSSQATRKIIYDPEEPEPYELPLMETERNMRF